MYKYLCSKCDLQCQQHKAVSKPKQNTLGTWHCPKHGKVAVKREKA